MDVLGSSTDRLLSYVVLACRLTLLLMMCVRGVTSEPCFYSNEDVEKLCTCDRATLNCSARLLSAVPTSIRMNIVTLNFSGNDIEEIGERNFSHSEKIKKIYLQGNRISFIHENAFRNLFSLEIIYLQDNRISFIHENTFRNLFSLEIINLDRNKLQSLDPTGLTFQHLSSLSLLSLQSNNISSINKNTFLTMPASSETVTVNLNQNPITCACDVLALKKLINHPAVRSRLNITNLMCYNDPENRSFTEVPDSVFGSCTDTQGGIFSSDYYCPTCKNEATNDGCSKHRKRKCSGTQVCHKQLQWQSSKMSISSQCQEYEHCIKEERQNERCGHDGDIVVCNFCCQGPTCLNDTIGGRTKDFSILLSYKRENTSYQDFMDDIGIPRYSKEEERIGDGVKSIIHSLKGGIDVYVEKYIKENEQHDPFETVLRLEVTTFSTQTMESVIHSIVSDFMNSTEQPNSFLNKEQVINQSITTESFTEHCPLSFTNLENKGNITWSASTVGFYAKQCPYSVTGNPVATRNCSIRGTAEWSNVNDSLCATLDEQTFQMPLSTNNSETISVLLEEYTEQKSGNFTEGTVSYILDRVEEFKNETLLVTSKVAANLVNSLSLIIGSAQRNDSESILDRNISRRILGVIDYISEKAPLSNGTLKVVTPNLAVVAHEINSTKAQNLILTADTDSSGGFSNNTISVSVVTEGASEFDNRPGIFMPVQAILDSNSSASKDDLKRVSFVVFQLDSLFDAIKNGANRETHLTDAIQKSLFEKSVSYDHKENKNSKFTTKINSFVIAASIPGVKVHNLTENVTINFVHSETNSMNPQCVFWDESLSSGVGNWSRDGCGVVNTSSRRTICGCNHLTSFALLMDVFNSHASDHHRKILSILSYVGFGVSLFGLFLTFLTYSLFRKFRNDNPSKILMNLCMSMMLSSLTFLAGMQDYAFNNIVSCKAVAVLMHYFLLSSLSWMVVEAFYMYLAIVRVFRTYFHNFILKCSVIGWGVPLVIVVITLAVNATDNYAFIKGELCWLENSAFYGAFVGPVCFILLINCIAFVLVFKQILSVTSPKCNKTNKNSTLRRLRGAVGIVILLGLTWLFAIFAIGEASVVFNYLFAVFNSLQGLFIFIFYCLMKKDVINTWKKALLCFEDYGETSSSRGFLIKTGNTKL